MHAGIYLVLERNDSSGFNPDAAKERLEAEGITVKRFDVRGSAQLCLYCVETLFFLKALNGSSGLMNNTSMSGSEKMPGGNDLRIAAALCHCPLLEIRAANCSSHVLPCCCDEAPIA